MSGYHPPNRADVAKSTWFTWIQPSLAIRARKNASSLFGVAADGRWALSAHVVAEGLKQPKRCASCETHVSLVNKTGSSPRWPFRRRRS